MIRSYKYRIYPSNSQKTNIENQFSMCRHLFNRSLEERIQFYEKEKKTFSYYQQANQLPELKQQRPWYKGVHSQVLQDVLKRLDKAFQAFFRRLKQGEKPGFPKFKKKGQYNSITYPQFSQKPENGELNIPKIGKVKIQYHREIPSNGKIKTLTISKQGTKWFVSFSVEIPFNIELKPIKSCIGIDLGLIFFFKGSDGSEVKVPKFFRKSEKKLKILQRRFEKAGKRTPKYFKILRALQKVHFKISCQRNDFLHKTANALLEDHDLIVVEDLQIKNMTRKPKAKQGEQGQFLPNGASQKSGLSKSIHDVGWFGFVSMLEWKAERLGKTVLKVPPHFTSQKCSGCGVVVKKSLSQRTHRCECGLVLDRDENAARNILSLGLGMQSQLQAHACSKKPLPSGRGAFTVERKIRIR